MPTYEYRCVNCNYQFEKRQKINEKPIEYCPQCHGRVKKIITDNVNFILKGTGFYKNDYSSSRNKNEKERTAGKSCAHPKYCCQK